MKREKKILCLLCAAALLMLVPAGCAAGGETSGTPASDPVSASEPAPDTGKPAEGTEPAAPEDGGEGLGPGEADDPAETGEADETAGPDEPEDPEALRGHYRFQPKVCSSYMTAVFGETMTETWFNLVDAVMAGEDTFACPDDDTYNWVMGQYRDRCFPLLVQLIDYCYERDDPVKDGVGSFVYLVPPEEAAARIGEFAALVEEILNSTLRDDYSDFEKALALYLYFSHHYVYDYESARPDFVALDYLSAYRVLTTGTGICQEFSAAYSYLLLQAGVDASTMSGHRSSDGEAHQWSYVNINGHNFHIDPTYVICINDSLSYFMMDDEQREFADGYSREDFVICSHYSRDHPHPDYTAEDDSFRELWGSYFVEMDHEHHLVTCVTFSEGWKEVVRTVDYSGW